MGNQTTKGTKQHYLPACVIGRFSQDKDNQIRNRHVQVLRRESKQPYRAKASTLCTGNGMYDGERFPDGTIDHWDYEKNLTKLFDALKEGRIIDLDYFVHDLVPYVTGLFMRGLDFKDRMEHRLNPIKINNINDNINGDRLFEMQRLLSVILAAQWTCLHAPCGMRFILGDIGLCQAKIENQSSWIIPIDPELALQIVPQKQRHIADYMKNKRLWIARIKHQQLHDAAMQRINRITLLQAQHSCFAKDEKDFISEFPPRSKNDNIAAAETAFGIEKYFSVEELIEHEFEWYGLSRIAAEHMSPTAASRLCKNRPYFGYYDDHWKPQLPIIASNITFFDSGVSIKKRKLFLNLSETDDFETHLQKDAWGSNKRQIQ